MMNGLELAGQLFVHRVYPQGKTEKVYQALRNGWPLFSLDGRATLQLGTLRDFGQNFVFYIPWEEQTKVIEAPRITPYERWVCPGAASLKQPPAENHLEKAERWLKKVMLKRKPFLHTKDIINIQDVRALPSEYLVGTVDLQENQIDPETLLPSNLSFTPVGHVGYFIKDDIITVFEQGIYLPSRIIRDRMNRINTAAG